MEDTEAQERNDFMENFLDFIHQLYIITMTHPFFTILLFLLFAFLLSYTNEISFKRGEQAGEDKGFHFGYTKLFEVLVQMGAASQNTQKEDDKTHG